MPPAAAPTPPPADQPTPPPPIAPPPPNNVQFNPTPVPGMASQPPQPPAQPSKMGKLNNAKARMAVFAAAFAAIGGAFLLFSHAAPLPTTFSLNPYSSKANQLDKFSSGLSLYNQPWRGYMETLPANQFQAGLGVNYDLPATTNTDAAMKTLSDNGITTVRDEVDWGSMKADESDLEAAPKKQLIDLVTAAKKYKITPLITLSSLASDPAPLTNYSAQMATAAASGATSLTLKGTSVTKLPVSYTGIDLSPTSSKTAVAAGDIFTKIEAKSGNTVVTLSKPLPTALKANATVNLSTLKYLPLYAADQKEFKDTSDGFVKFAKLVAKTVADAGADKFEVEIWNNTAKGGDMLDINNYYKPALDTANTDIFAKNGKAWTLADNTTKALKAVYSDKVNVIWGFSNADPYRTPTTDLPANTAVEAYHPYGNKSMAYADVVGANKSKLLGPDGKANSFIPTAKSSNPEGRDAFQVLSGGGLLTQKLAPGQRGNVKHYFTLDGLQENVVKPSECETSGNAAGCSNSHSPDGQWRAESILRLYMFWLSKGVDKLVLDSADDTNSHSGLLSGSANTTADAALKAVGNVTKKLKGTSAITTPRQLDADVTATGKQQPIFGTGNNTLWSRDLFTLLPFQVSDKQFVVADYMLTPNNVNGVAPEGTFDVTLKNVDGANAQITNYDPIQNKNVPVKVKSHDATSITFTVTASDYPRLIMVDETPAPTVTAEPFTGYVGCDNSTDAVRAYIAAGGKHFWTPPSGDVYHNGTIRRWSAGLAAGAKGTPANLWKDFGNMLKTNTSTTKATTKIWFNLCTSPTATDSDADNYTAAVAVLDGLKKKAPAATVYVSAINGYVAPHTCSDIGADGPTRMQTLADRLVSEGKATAGPTMTKLFSAVAPASTGTGSTETTSDGCSPNNAGKTKLGTDLVTAFGK